MNKKILLLLIIILSIACFFRLWKLNSIPPGLYPDVAMNGTDALSAIKNHDFKIFYPENNGREGLFINLIGFSFLIFGISIWSIKIVSAIIGILTVLGIFLFTKEIFKLSNFKPNVSDFIALLSSFFLAISFWHVNFSRMGFRAIFTPFILVFSLYFLFKGLRTKKILDLIIGGAIFGLGFHTYISFRLAVLLLAFLFIIWLLIYYKEKILKKFFLFSFFIFISIVIVAIPIGFYFMQHPGDFIGRATGVSVFSQPNPIKSFVRSFVIHLGMFNFYGDPNWRHNIALSPIFPWPSPLLFWPIGIAFLIGFVLSIKKSLYFLKNKDYPQLLVYSTILIWLFVMILPSALTYEGIPHALRSIGAIPPAFILSAIGFVFLYQKIKDFLKVKSKIALFLGLILCLSWFSYGEYNRYFVVWGQSPAVKGAFDQGLFDIGNYLNSLPNNVKTYVIVNELQYPLYGISIPGQTPMFIENTKFGTTRANYIKAQDLDKIVLGDKNTVIIPIYKNSLFNELKRKFPEAKIIEKETFVIFEIEK
ncbi:MAG: glycosyltransferase family 39 protein [Candidatus Nealsonbacteria bacterium]|nr:glycosyltransferase family 39 protein [Candidatus Nealsonbacteria bacterium]